MSAPQPSPPLPCPFCQGAGEVRGPVDDIEFAFACVCNGGHLESIDWLLSEADDYGI